MDNDDFIASLMACAIVFALIIGVAYGSYLYGKYAERRALTQALIAGTEETYYAGRADAEKDCRAGVIK